jgi:uncharacterized protein (TIGR03086 family)
VIPDETVSDEAMLREALRASRELLDDVISAISVEDWDRSTPCEGWSVYDVVNHLVGGAVRYRMLLEGASAAQVATRFKGDDVGSDVVAASRASADALFAAATGDLTRIVHHRGGDRSAADLLVTRVFEQTLHAWDIASGLGMQIRADPGVTRYLRERLDLVRAGQARGVYATRLSSDDEAEWSRLLAETGRG